MNILCENYEKLDNASIFVSESRRGKQVVSQLDHPMISSYRMNLHSWVEMVYFVT